MELLSRRPVNLLILFDQRLINKRKSKTFSLIPNGIENQEKGGREEVGSAYKREREGVISFLARVSECLTCSSLQLTSPLNKQSVRPKPMGSLSAPRAWIFPSPDI